MLTPTDQPRPTSGMTAESWIFAAVPFITLGLFTWAAFGYASARVRSRPFVVASVGYVVAMIAMCVAAAIAPSGGEPNAGRSVADDVGVTILIGTWLVGTLHALLLRGRFARELAAQRSVAPPPVRYTSSLHAQDPAIAAALARRERRLQAMAIVANDPALANELRIGRPDLPRQYDDGGLVDVNRVPAGVLATLPGFTPALADAVVAARERTGGLIGPHDLVVFADVPPHVVSDAGDRLLFRPLNV